MTAKSKSGRAPSKGSAARAEGNGKPLTLQHRGLKLKLPNTTLSSEVAYAFAELEGSEQQLYPFMQLVKSLIGEEQLTKVREKQAADGIGFDEVADDLVKLVDNAFKAYGAGLGEASASSSS